MRGTSRWAYVLPSLHFFVCLTSYVGVIFPSLHYLGIIFSFVLLADLPISLPAYIVGWKYSALAVIWIFVAGTFWWYLLGRAMQAVFLGFIHRNDPPAQLIG